MTAYLWCRKFSGVMNTIASVSSPVSSAIAWALSHDCQNHVAADIAAKSQRWGALSQKQEAYLLNAHRWATQRQVEAQAKAEAGITAPAGRQVVTGTVTKVTQQYTQFGEVLKVMVDLPSGARVRGNSPSAITPNVGDVVTFTASFTQADGDQSFAFWSRPTKWTKGA